MATMMDAPVSVTSTPTGGSRLAQMQARFQQKQMQEKEQKLLRLYESQTQRAFQRVGRGSAGSSTSSSVSSTSSSLGAGKVRQLFQERRHTNGNKAGGSGPTGWDRSYPLEPLETTTTTITKQRLQASKSTGNLKAARGTSLERAYSNNDTTNNQHQIKNQARRSKSQVRSNNYVTADLNSSFRQLTLSQQKLYDGEDYDEVDYPQNHNPRAYQDEQNNRIREEREYREVELFHKHRTYDDNDIENEDPPFQQLDDDLDDFNDSSRAFQKLPNVGGRLLMENKANNNHNNNNNNDVDRYKTYNATNNGVRSNRRNLTTDKEEDSSRKMTPPAAVRERRDNQDAAKPRPARKSDIKVPKHSSPSKASPPKSTTPIKPDSGHQKTSTNSGAMLGKKPVPPRGQVPQQTSPSGPTSRGQPARKTPPRGPPARTPATRGPPGRGPPGAQAASDLTECRICGRHFASDRIATHQEICAKTSQKKRKVFDPIKQRVKGTEAESFLRKGRPQTVKIIKKSNWRQKHEDFINSIRAAKEMKEHLARGGKLADLPPPPPSDYSDYVQCPHCSRRFNQQAAERHIPKCANFEFNKPKPQAAGKGTPQRGAVPRKR